MAAPTASGAVGDPTPVQGTVPSTGSVSVVDEGPVPVEVPSIEPSPLPAAEGSADAESPAAVPDDVSGTSGEEPPESGSGAESPSGAEPPSEWEAVDMLTPQDDEPESPVEEEPAALPEVPSEFDIDLVFDVDDQLDEEVTAAFERARERWQQVIVGDLLDFQGSFTPTCDRFEVPDFVDDLVIFVTLRRIDGPNGILGAAGPCLIRGEGLPLPFAGRMEFDLADLQRFSDEGRLDEIVLHEMGHVLGIGSLWPLFDLLEEPAADGSGAADTAFLGPLAIERFDAAGGAAYDDGAKVPVENMGGDGVANGHWRESVLGNELMTPYMSNLPGLLSDVTIASLEDLGYEVSYGVADTYSWPPQQESFGFFAASVEGSGISLHDDGLNAPIYAVDEDGRTRRVK